MRCKSAELIRTLFTPRFTPWLGFQCFSAGHHSRRMTTYAVRITALANSGCIYSCKSFADPHSAVAVRSLVALSNFGRPLPSYVLFCHFFVLIPIHSNAFSWTFFIARAVCRYHGQSNQPCEAQFVSHGASRIVYLMYECDLQALSYAATCMYREDIGLNGCLQYHHYRSFDYLKRHRWREQH